MNSTPCVKHCRQITIDLCLAQRTTFRTMFICNCTWAVHAILVKRFCEIKQNDSSLNQSNQILLDSSFTVSNILRPHLQHPTMCLGPIGLNTIYHCIKQSLVKQATYTGGQQPVHNHLYDAS